jgi:hypothetical protein
MKKTKVKAKIKKEVYRLTLTKKQAYVIQSALESYYRMAIGQFKTSIEEVWMSKIFGTENFDSRRLEDICFDLLRLFLGEDVTRGTSYSISSTEVPDNARIAVDIHQVLRHRLSYDRHPQGGITVNFNEPFAYSGEPLPVIERGEVSF